MCRTCYTDAGSPMDRTPTTDRLVALIGLLYEVHGTGGPLHVVLDDWNIDGPIRPWYEPKYWPAEELDKVDDDLDGHTLRWVCDQIAALMNDMTEAQRATALALFDGYAEVSA